MVLSTGKEHAGVIVDVKNEAVEIGRIQTIYV